jgi:hypothetical protein
VNGTDQTSPPASWGAWGGLILHLTVRAVLRPRLALDLLGTAWAFRRRDWLRSPPFLPVPSREYLRWRMYTAYGDEDAVPPAEDVIRFAEWRRKLLRL